ncbi:MAG: sugar kinase, partial [Firmicutes bacterium]|nr:sugar kinase [Bacillota bacterium]
MMGFLAGVVASGHPTLDQLKQAMGYGTIVASYNIEAFSLDRMKQITRDDVDRRYEEYAAMLRLP